MFGMAMEKAGMDVVSSCCRGAYSSESLYEFFAEPLNRFELSGRAFCYVKPAVAP